MQVTLVLQGVVGAVLLRNDLLQHLLFMLVPSILAGLLITRGLRQLRQPDSATKRRGRLTLVLTLAVWMPYFFWMLRHLLA